MSAHKNIDRICIFITAVTIVLALIFCNGQAFGVKTTAHAAGYENRLFDHSKVHSIDIVINDWDGFIEGCESEEYSACNVVIDGEAVKNVGIRAKGNTSLSSVKNMNSSRYSFKIEFDQYENGKSYHGLDKLCLNNIIQDNTYMKDYLAYTLMYDFGVDAPLCSYAYITVNGEDWGLYLAVEAIEESFLERNYGSNFGDLYKPDALGFGGGRGNGKDFSMGNFMNKDGEDKDSSDKSDDNKNSSANTGGFGGMPDFGNMPDFGGNMPQFDPDNMPEDFSDFDPSKMFGDGKDMPDFGGGNGGFGGFGMGSDDVKLKYTDDDIDSYSNIFNNAKTPVDKADKKRLIKALKALSEESDIESTVDVEEVIRYFVVHNFLVNGDSYTGQMIHNYYLYEKDGQLSMIPWDYNLAYGSFMGGQASSSVNSPIDTPVSGDMSDRPMISWIFDSDEYTEQYHELFSEFIGSVDFEELISETAELIDKYVEKDPTKFCTYEEFRKGVEAITQFCTLREESVSGQLDGSIPATTDGQKADSSALIDTNGLNTSDMGSMGGGKGGFGRNNRTEQTDTSEKTEITEVKQTSYTSSFSVKMLSNVQLLKNEEDTGADNKPQRGGERPDFGGQAPQGFGGKPPENFDPDNLPDGFDPGDMPDLGGGMPEGFDPGNMPGGKDFPGDNKTSEEVDNDTSNDGKTVENEKGSDREETVPSPADQNRSRGGERPSAGGFPSMNASEKDNGTEYIMLGISALVLLLGLGFAVKFRR